MRANVYGWCDREVMVSKYSEKLARLYTAEVELYKLIIEDAEISKIEAAVSRVATLSFELTEMPDVPETVKEWHQRITGKAFPKNAAQVAREVFGYRRADRCEVGNPPATSRATVIAR